MKQYELLTLVSGTLSEHELEAAQDAIRTILEKNRASITKHQLWEKRKLAYPINHVAIGVYFVTHFDADPKAVSALETALRLEKLILRHMVTEFIPKSAKALEREARLKKGDERATEKVIISKEDLEEKLEKILTEDVVK